PVPTRGSRASLCPAGAWWPLSVVEVVVGGDVRHADPRGPGGHPPFNEVPVDRRDARVPPPGGEVEELPAVHDHAGVDLAAYGRVGADEVLAASVDVLLAVGEPGAGHFQRR